MNKLFIIFSLTFALIYSTQGHAQDHIVLRDEEIKLVAPIGFTNILELSPELANLAANFVPETNLLLGYYIPTENARKLLLPEHDLLEAMQTEKRFMIQVNKQTIQNPITEDDYIKIKKMIEGEQETLLKKHIPKANNALNESVQNALKQMDLKDIEASLNISNVIPLNDVFDGGSFFQFGNIMKVSGSFNDGTNKQPVTAEVIVNEAAFTAVNGHMFYLYSYNSYKTEEDIKWIQDKSKEWATRFVTGNKNLPSFKPQVTIQKSEILEKSISGGIGGAVAVVIISIISAGFALLKNLFKKKDN